jgi:hypothetical protein
MQVVEILEGKQGQEVDMQELFARFTLDSIGGNSHHTRHNTTHESTTYRRRGVGARSCFPWYRDRVREEDRIAGEARGVLARVQPGPASHRLPLPKVLVEGTQIPSPSSIGWLSTDFVRVRCWVQWMPWIDTEREMREALKVLDEFAYGIIKERRQDSNIATKTGNSHHSPTTHTHTWPQDT